MVRPNGSQIGCSLGAWHEKRDMTAELLGWKEGLTLLTAYERGATIK